MMKLSHAKNGNQEEDEEFARGDSNQFGSYPLKKEWEFWNQVSELRCLIRYQTLRAELNATPTEHQIIRPMKGEELRDAQTNIAYVKNGQNPQMAYTQVHYLKGYFLLHYLCDSIEGKADKFFAFLRHYAHDLFHGKLVHSTDFLRLYFETFAKETEFQSRSLEENIAWTCDTWLDTPRMPEYVTQRCTLINNPLLNQVKRLTETFLSTKSNKRGLAIRQESNLEDSICQEDFAIATNFLPEQWILFLEELIKSDDFSKNLACQKRLLKLKLKVPEETNADVQHRWCELIIACGWRSQFSKIADFLRQHQSMGVYLYSEMIWSHCKKLNKMAKEIFKELEQEMDTSTRNNIQNIFNE